MFENTEAHGRNDHRGSTQEYLSCNPQQAYQRGFTDGLKAREKGFGWFAELFSKHHHYRGDRNYPDAYKAGYYAGKNHHH